MWLTIANWRAQLPLFPSIHNLSLVIFLLSKGHHLFNTCKSWLSGANTAPGAIFPNFSDDLFSDVYMLMNYITKSAFLNSGGVNRFCWYQWNWEEERNKQGQSLLGVYKWSNWMASSSSSMFLYLIITKYEWKCPTTDVSNILLNAVAIYDPMTSCNNILQPI